MSKINLTSMARLEILCDLHEKPFGSTDEFNELYSVDINEMHTAEFLTWIKALANQLGLKLHIQ